MNPTKRKYSTKSKSAARKHHLKIINRKNNQCHNKTSTKTWDLIEAKKSITTIPSVLVKSRIHY